MGRTIAGVDFGALLPQVFAGLLEPVVLRQLGTEIACEGVVERLDDGGRVTLVVGLGDLTEDIRPYPNSTLHHGDDVLLIQDVAGMDQIVYECRCSTYLDETRRAPAPNITATRTSAGTGVQLTLDDPLPPNHSWRTKWRYGTATGWGNVAVTSQRVRHIAGLRADELVVVESIVLNGEAEASMPTYTPVEVTP